MTDLLRFKLIGSSERFQAALTHLRKVAGVDATVLIQGETGTGKELAARAIHYTSKRSERPFLPVNCGALAEALLESELFGHERGAFTDAKSASAGLVAEADGGTLFLDEVDALSPKAQAAMLRFLQDRSYRRVGSAQTRHAHVRIIVASNACLEDLVNARQFRRDLLYRLNVLTLHMPALRERAGDVLELAHSFVTRFCHEYRQPARTLAPEFLADLANQEWPGNVRELENTIHRAFLLGDGLELRHPGLAAEPAAIQATAIPFKEAKAHAIADFERRYIGEVLRKSDGNITRAAQMAGQDRSAFGKMVRKHGLGAAAE